MALFDGKHVRIERKNERFNSRFKAKSVEYIIRIKTIDDDDDDGSIVDNDDGISTNDDDDSSTDDGMTTNDDDDDGDADDEFSGSDVVYDSYDSSSSSSENSSKEKQTIDPHQWMHDSFQEIIDFGTRNAQPHHYIGIKINVPDSENTHAIGMSFRPINSVSSEILVDIIQSVIQSNSVFDVSHRLEIAMTIIETPAGGNFVRATSLNEKNIFKHKRASILLPRGEYNDQKCLPRALVLGKIFADGCSKETEKKYTRCRSKILRTKTDLLIKKAVVSVDIANGCYLNDIHKFAHEFKQYQIQIYDDLHNPTSFIYRSAHQNKQINLFYLRDSNHFITLKSARAFFGFRYQCKHCDKMMNCEKKHHCLHTCNYCRKSPLCPNVAKMIPCTDCNRTFKGDFCFQRHKRLDTENESTCTRYRICKECFKFINIQPERSHICSDKFCNICRRIVAADHECFIQPYNKNTPQRFCILIFDIESRQEQLLNNNSKSPEYLHEANLCVVSQVSAFFFFFSFFFYILFFFFCRYAMCVTQTTIRMWCAKTVSKESMCSREMRA